MKTETFETNTKETNPSVLIDTFFKIFPDEYGADDEKKIRSAWTFLIDKTATLKRSCGLPYYLHPMRVACVLAKSRFGADTVIAGFFHNLLEVDSAYINEIEQLFGHDVAVICSGTAKITGLKMKSSSMQQADSIRKMLFAMVDDIRVILVKLADRLDRMRNLRNVSAVAQKEVAAEVIDIWAPLAGRLGMKDVKNEMEDLSLKYSNPEAFQQVKAIVSQKKQERETYLAEATKKIHASTERAGIHVSISSRAKHFYSIYQKMRKRGKEPGELYDLLALRIICSTESECYTLIGIVHGLWKPMEGRFKDYIAMPKSNGYQSLHTTVICEGKPLEIQIRTEKMHNIAEHGVASHWLYKKGTNKDLVKADDLSIINQLRALRDEHLTDEAFFSELKNELLGDSIFVFTPQGDVKQLPQGSCAIDFAYSVHSAIGEKIVGAKADGKIIPLTTPLKNTQIVEILTNPKAHPTEAQLKAVKTSKAHQKIHAWLSANDPTFIGRTLEKKEAEVPVAPRHTTENKAKDEKKRRSKKSTTDYTGKIRIDGDTHFLITIAGCCSPEAGEPIVGYVSRSRGITVHKADCLTFLRIPNIATRTVNVEWETGALKKDAKEESAKEKEKALAKQKAIQKSRFEKLR